MTVDFLFKEKYNIDDLKSIVKILRGENGCPWDKEQDHYTIRKNFIEEVYEAIDAIDSNDSQALCEELGDVLLQVVFHSQMEDEKSVFNFDDVANGICHKLILRHPHIFSDTKVSGTDEVLKNWTIIKRKEKNQDTATQTLEAVPRVLPALMRADKLQSRAQKAGADTTAVASLKSMTQAMDTLINGVKQTDKEMLASGVGEMLFECVNFARRFGLDAEELLTRKSDDFIMQFGEMEKAAKELKTSGIQGEPPHEDIKN